jgi:hypothetical protein
MDIPTSFILIFAFLTNFRIWLWSKFFLGYVGKDSDPLCIEFCNFVQCRKFVSYLTLDTKSDTTLFSWHDNGIILEPGFILWHSLSNLF